MFTDWILQKNTKVCCQSNRYYIYDNNVNTFNLGGLIMQKMRPDSKKREADVAFGFVKNAQMVRHIKTLKSLLSILERSNEIIGYDDLMFVELIDIASNADDNLNTSNFTSFVVDVVQGKFQLQAIDEFYKEINVSVPENLDEEAVKRYLELKEHENDLKKNQDVSTVNRTIEGSFDRMLDVILFYAGYFNRNNREAYPEVKELIATKYFGNNTSVQDVMKSFVKIMKDILEAVYK